MCYTVNVESRSCEQSINSLVVRLFPVALKVFVLLETASSNRATASDLTRPGDNRTWSISLLGDSPSFIITHITSNFELSDQHIWLSAAGIF